MIHQTIPKPRSGQRTDQSKPYASPARLSDRSVQRVSDGAPPSGHNFADVAVHPTDSQPAARVRSTVPSHRTGLPDALKAGVERFAGISLDDVRVHYNSAKPAQLDALAFTQGRDIHVAPGQEQHLPHEAWHVVQQKQERVRATMQMQSGVAVNDDSHLEGEADRMGTLALRGAPQSPSKIAAPHTARASSQTEPADPVQRVKKSLRARVRDKLVTEGYGNLKKREVRFATLRNEKDRLAGKRPKADELEGEIEKRRRRRAGFLSQKAKEFRDGDRPTKPKELEAKDEKNESLTAHHLFPYNRIRDDITAAMERQDLSSIRNFMAFRGDPATDESDAFRLLSYQREHTPSKAWVEHQSAARESQKKEIAERAKEDLDEEAGIGFDLFDEGSDSASAPSSLAAASSALVLQPDESQDLDPPHIAQSSAPDSSAIRLGRFFSEAAWAPQNIFMGPAPASRADDPHEGLDRRVTREGRVTEPSLLARKMFVNSVGQLDNAGFHQQLKRARRDAEDTRPYRAEDWEETQDGVRDQKGNILLGRRQERLLEDMHKRRTQFWK